MPQLDFSTFSPQLVWLVITFGLLYFVMARFALPRVGEVLEERQNRIDGDLEKAEKLKSESQKLEADYEALVATAKAEATSHLKAEREKIEASIEEKRAQMASELEQKIADAEQRIANARTKAMKDVESIALEACTTIVSQLSGHKPTATVAKKAISTTQSGKAV